MSEPAEVEPGNAPVRAVTEVGSGGKESEHAVAAFERRQRCGRVDSWPMSTPPTLAALAGGRAWRGWSVWSRTERCVGVRIGGMSYHRLVFRRERLLRCREGYSFDVMPRTCLSVCVFHENPGERSARDAARVMACSQAEMFSGEAVSAVVLERSWRAVPLMAFAHGYRSLSRGKGRFGRIRTVTRCALNTVDLRVRERTTSLGFRVVRSVACGAKRVLVAAFVEELSLETCGCHEARRLSRGWIGRVSRVARFL